MVQYERGPGRVKLMASEQLGTSNRVVPASEIYNTIECVAHVPHVHIDLFACVLARMTRVFTMRSIEVLRLERDSHIQVTHRDGIHPR